MEVGTDGVKKLKIREDGPYTHRELARPGRICRAQDGAVIEA